MKTSLAVSWSLLATSACASWVPASPALARNLEPKPQKLIPRQSGNGTSEKWPYGPLSTKGRDIVNSRGEAVTWAGLNWPMSGETMVPEGLEHKSVEEILDDIVDVGFNSIRMGYAIQMIDEVYDRGGEDVPLEVAMIMALGYENGTKVTNDIIAKNPGWTRETTRFEIWSDIADTAAEKGVYIHPDVHIHKAQWCCSHSDGNSWFGDIDFDIDNWHRGLAYVAEWAKAHRNVVSMSLRNELRESWNRTDLVYNWVTLAGNLTAATDVIHAANPDLLVTWSGMQFDEDLSALTTGKNLLTAPCYKCTATRDALRRDPVRFDLAEHPWADKVVWELHLYSMSEDIDAASCEFSEAALYRNGFNALGIDPPQACSVTKDCPEAARLTPVILSEFGNAQDATLNNGTLPQCLRDFTTRHGVSWMMWSLAGSYRIRSGSQALPDTWGLTNNDWTGWRDPGTIESYWKPWIADMNITRGD